VLFTHAFGEMRFISGVTQLEHKKMIPPRHQHMARITGPSCQFYLTIAEINNIQQNDDDQRWPNEDYKVHGKSSLIQCSASDCSFSEGGRASVKSNFAANFITSLSISLILARLFNTSKRVNDENERSAI
jgi:hypothetical protein